MAAVEIAINEDCSLCFLQKETAMCTHVESPVTVWLQIVSDENTKRIFNITEQLSALCPAAPKLSGQPDMNKVNSQS